MRLIADIGGTNARFMLAAPNQPPLKRWNAKVADYASFEAALEAYLDFAGHPALSEICIDIAGPVSDGAARLTNATWHLSEADMRALTGATHARLFNDLEAFALAVPHFGTSSAPLEPGCVRTAKTHAPSLVIAPGTGLGAAIYVPTREGGSSGTVIGTESGHPRMVLSSGTLFDRLSALIPVHDHSPEMFLSGPGLTRIDRALNGCARRGEDIASQAMAGDAGARAVMDGFFDMLARFAGAAVLLTGTLGGVYLAGGIVRGALPLIDAKRFRKRFIDHPPMSDMLDRVPLQIVTEQDPALLGLASFRFT